MARLECARRTQWKETLAQSSAAWVACGIDAEAPSSSAKVEGMVGLIDWLLHGQVSNILLRQALAPGDFFVVPGNPSLRRPSFLFLHYDSSADPKEFSRRLKQLLLDEITLAESTFPEDFLAKVKQTLKKEGIRCTMLEPHFP